MQISNVLKAVALAAAVVSAPAFAATITTDPSAGPLFIESSTSGLSFSNDAIIAFSLGGVAVTGVAPATYTAPTVTNNVVRVETDAAGVATKLVTNGGALQTVATAGLTGGPGFLSVTNVTIDVASKTAFADISGANGVVAATIPFFKLANITGDTSVTGPGTFTSGANGLTVTPEAVAALTKGLALNGFGANVLAGIKDFGTLNATFTVTAVPEPSTYALMGLGLVGAGLVARRRAAR